MGFDQKSGILMGPYLPLGLLILFTACTSKNKTSQIPPPGIQDSTTSIDKKLTPWIQRINAHSDELKSMYLTNAVKINSKGEVLEGNTSILAYYKKNPLDIDSLQVLSQIEANTEKRYEIGKIHSPGHKTYLYVQIWHKANNTKQIELEFIEESKITTPVIDEINKARKEWINLCNLHDAARLIDKLYTVNALYYNHKPMITGRKAIAQEYRYMNNEKYHLTLEPIVSEMVNEKIVFEIGQCIGSYGGKYIIVWQKNESGAWQVLLDSNF